MIVTIHQPESLPWTGFFHKMMCADLYVYLDHVQYRKNYVQNRNKIVKNQGTVGWATIPVEKKGGVSESIMGKKIVPGYSNKFISLIKSSYQNEKYFDKYFDKLNFILKKEHRYLVDLNLELIDFFREALKITTPTVRSSALNITSSKSQMILDICVNLDATNYIAGPLGLDYLDKDSFKDHNIKLLVHNYISPLYQDIYCMSDSSNNFYPNLSTLDLLFKNGENSRQIILNSGNISKHG
tara:strand:+ start:178 stop:897 length:720 start_codon:yes stop_codon:yes gene_type:complete